MKCYIFNEQREEFWRQVTMVAKFLDDNNKAKIKQRRQRQ